MTEIPEHLLQRTRDRRVALGLLSPEEAGSGVPQVAPTETANTPAVVGAGAPAAAPAKAPVPLPASEPPPPPPPEAPWVTAAKGRKKVPAWVMPVLLFLPVWAFMYVGLLEEPTREEGVLYEGGKIYAEHCASCHGGGGGGGIGPAFTNGAVVAQFSTATDQVEWITKGTEGFLAEGRAEYGSNGDVNAGEVMPAFAEKLTSEELFLVTYYERVELGGHEEGLAEAEAVYDAFDHGEIKFDDHFDPETITADDLANGIASITEELASE